MGVIYRPDLIAAGRSSFPAYYTDKFVPTEAPRGDDFIFKRILHSIFSYYIAMGQFKMYTFRNKRLSVSFFREERKKFRARNLPEAD